MQWDETCDRLLAWKAGQGPSERLAAQVLASEGFSSIDPSHPLGGPDGGADATCKRGGEDWIMAVYFPRGQKTFAAIKRKFRTDLKGASSRGATRIAFVTNQEIHQADRKRLRDLAKPAVCDLYHLDRITSILDQPKMAQVRRQFLGIGDGPDQVAEGGKGGNAPGAAGGGGGAIGGGARGGDGVWLRRQ